MAGSVSAEYYLNNFLSEHLPEEARLQGSFNAHGQRGPIKLSFIV